jgi:predicted RNase H-like HicB family nuclease
MAPDVLVDRCGLSEPIVFKDFTIFGSKTFKCRVLLVPEEEGGYSAYALRLPGVVSCGDTIEEAVANMEDAFRLAIGYYIEEEQTIPWADAQVERTRDSHERWILVDV